VKPYVSKDKLKVSIYNCSILQGVYFHDFLDYFTDDQLKQMNQGHLDREFRKEDWLFTPQTAAEHLKIVANIKSMLRKVVKPKKENLFKELPFQDVSDTEIILNPNRKTRRKMPTPPKKKTKMQTLRQILPSNVQSPPKMQSPSKRTLKRARASPYSETPNKRAKTCDAPGGNCTISGGTRRKQRK